MASRHERAAVHPNIPKSAFTPALKTLLQTAGFAFEDRGNDYYLHAERALDDSVPWKDALQALATLSGVAGIVVRGAWWTEGVEPADYGGFVVYVTPRQVKSVSTETGLDEFTWAPR